MQMIKKRINEFNLFISKTNDIKKISKSMIFVDSMEKKCYYCKTYLISIYSVNVWKHQEDYKIIYV